VLSASSVVFAGAVVASDGDPHVGARGTRSRPTQCSVACADAGITARRISMAEV